MTSDDRYREAESEAVRRCLGGSVDAFEPLVREHSPRIIRLAYHFLGDWDEARDLAQEAFARAYLCLQRYDPKRPFAPWLCAIAARLAADRLRRRRAMARRQAPTRRVPARAGADEPASLDVDPDVSLGLREALARLTCRQRQAVVLCDLHGFSAGETAEILGCTPSTVRVLRFLARRRLKGFLAGDARVVRAGDTPEPAPSSAAEGPR